MTDFNAARRETKQAKGKLKAAENEKKGLNQVKLNPILNQDPSNLHGDEEIKRGPVGAAVVLFCRHK